MSEVAAVDQGELVEVVVRMPAAMLDEISQYDSDVGYVVRRAVACLWAEEQRQAGALAARQRQPPGRRAVARK